MERTETLVIEINRHHGIEEDTVAYMLSCWVLTLANYEQWLEDDVIEILQEDYNLGADEIERVSSHILNALEGAGVHFKLANRKAFLVGANVEVKRDLACLKLIWG